MTIGISMNTDTDRLAFIMEDWEAIYFGVEGDAYDRVLQVADENGREAPTEADALEGFRRFIDEAMAVHHK